MEYPGPLDYQTYREIMDELTQPIAARDLDLETLKRLYESKLVYLENLRVKCFTEINSTAETFFGTDDYQLILRAIKETHGHLRNLVLVAVASGLEKRKVM